MLKEAFAFIKKDFLIAYSYKIDFLMSQCSSVFILFTFFFIAKLISKNATPYLAGYGGEYFPFLLIGIAFLGYLYTSFESFGRNLSREQITGTLEATLATPVKISTLIISMSLWNFVNATVKAVICLILGTLLLGVRFNNPNILAGMIILFFTIVSFSSIGIMSASFIMVFKRGNPINWTVGTLSTFLGGVFFPITILPKSLQVVSHFLPITYGLRALRHALLQGFSFASLAGDIIILLIFSAVLLPLSIICFRHSVKIAKQKGSLVYY